MGLFRRTPSTDPVGLAERLASHSVFVLDVREPGEFRHGHIQGAENVPLMRLKSRLGSLPRGKTVVTVCATGHRSAAAAHTLQQAGYDVENLKGGMHAWHRSGLPITRRGR